MNSPYWLNKIVEDVYHNSDTQFYIGLSSEVTVDGSNITVNEPTSGTGYERIHITDFTHAVNATISNASDIVFPESVNSWWSGQKQAAYWVLFDGAGSTAHILSFGRLDTPHYVERNTVLMIPSGLLAVTLMDYDPNLEV